jgi:hypothetical protein
MKNSQEMATRRGFDELVARSAAARSRPLTTVITGERVYFCRKMSPAKRLKDPGAQGTRGDIVGPAVLTGHHGAASVWLQYGGKLFLVALEHVRAFSNDEEAMSDGLLRTALDDLRQRLDAARQDVEYEDLTGQGLSHRKTCRTPRPSRGLEARRRAVRSRSQARAQRRLGRRRCLSEGHRRSCRISSVGETGATVMDGASWGKTRARGRIGRRSPR